MAPLIDTVMAVVPVANAGIGSAVNDVARGLGSALAEKVPAEVLELKRDGLGVATLAAGRLPIDFAATVTATANVVFVDAMTSGVIVSAAILIATRRR